MAAIAVRALAPGPSKTRQSPAPRLRLSYLDGLRGLAALYVALFHAWEEICFRMDAISPALYQSTRILAYGRLAVAVFIVLSGYCLMPSVLRDGNIRDLVGYFKRRARRILPPYYAALALSLALIAMMPGLNRFAGVNWDWALPAFTPGTLLSHIFLVHNMNPAWSGKIDPPLWSVATEWQIYFVFPLFLVPVWRRFGSACAVAVGFAVGWGLHLVGRPALDSGAPWFIGLFALGMAASAVSFSDNPGARLQRKRIPWGRFAVALFGLLYAILLFKPYLTFYGIYLDTLVGAATACLLIYCARFRSEETNPVPESDPAILRLLESPRLVGLGVISYSLYLIHSPILAALHLLIRSLGVTSASLAMALLVGVGIPLCVGLSRLFHIAFERPFMRLPDRLASPREELHAHAPAFAPVAQRKQMV